MSWPGKILANQISNSVSGLMDIFTTSLALANIPKPLRVVKILYTFRNSYYHAKTTMLEAGVGMGGTLEFMGAGPVPNKI